MLVLRRGSGDEFVRALRPRQDFFGRMARKRRARRIWRDYEHYRPTIPPGVELFSDDRSEHAGALLGQLPECDLINLHWVAGLLDHETFFAGYPRHVPLVWRLADMSGLTGGCHYSQGCEKFSRQCGACPQLGSSDENDLSRQVWTRKKRSLSLVGPGGLQIVGPSRWIASEARKSSLIGQFPITVIPNGLDVEEFAPRDKAYSRDLWSIPRDARVVLFAAESVANVRKGFALLIEALAGIKGIDNLLLVSVGGGKGVLPGGLPHLGLGKISSDRMLSTIYSAADVYVIPSLQESFGQTVIESLACATPVVGFASGGIPDMVRPGETGWLAPTGDTVALRGAIVEALRDDASRARMSEQCRRVAVEEYSLDVQAGGYVKLYETLIARSRATHNSVNSVVHAESTGSAALRPGA
jgi:glycosyltransferase involved in cell wall biosynthesis